MKYKYHSYWVGMLIITLLFIVGCDNAEYQEIDNKVYITKAETKNDENVYLVSGQDRNYFMSSRLANKAENDVVVNIDVDKSALDSYNKTNGTSFQLLPAEYYSLLSNEVTIEAGEINSAPIELNIKSFGHVLPKNINYAIPVSITEVKGGVSSLQSSSTLVLKVKEIMITNAVKFHDCSDVNRIDMKLSQQYPCEQWSAEFRLKLTDVNANNRATLWLTRDGNNQKHWLYSRFGDVNIKKDQYQTILNGKKFGPETRFVPNQWYHIALVYSGSNYKVYVDGEVHLSVGVDSEVYDIGGIGFGKLNAEMNEIRLYNKAIPQAQIQENMYNIIDPKTDGLIGYWPLNEGEGNVMKDLVNGCDITYYTDIEWVKGVRVPDVDI